MEPQNKVTVTFTRVDTRQKVTVTITDGKTSDVTFEPALNNTARRAYYHFAPHLQSFIRALASLNTVRDENNET